MIRGARQLLTLRGSHTDVRRGGSLRDLGIISDGAVLVRNGVIQEVGPTRRVENLLGARQAIEINAAGRVVMPGFVDSHTHLAFPLAGRPGEPAKSGAPSLRSTDTARLTVRARTHLDAMARHGTTTVEVKTGCGPDEAAETKLMRVFRALSGGPIELVPTFLFHLPGDDLEGTHNAAAEWVAAEFLPKLRQRKLVRFADLAWNPDPLYYLRFSRYLHAARRHGFPCKIHADQTSAADAVRMALDHLVVSIDHLEHATREHAARLGESSTIATLLPSAAFQSDSPFAPARALIDSGAAVALASNFNPGHTPTLSMQTVIALACRHMFMTPEEAISAATINGAHALGRAAETGSFEIGKSADLLILNAADYRDLACSFGSNLVHITMKRGEVIYQESEVARLSPDQLRLCW